MTQPLDIIITQTNVTPAATVTFRYPTAVTSDSDVDQAGEYLIDGTTLYLALTDADAKDLVAFPIDTVLKFSGRNPINSPITQDVSVTSFTEGATHATVGLSATPITEHGALSFSAALPGSSDTHKYWARRLDFRASALVGQTGAGLIDYNDSTYRVRPNPAWVSGGTFRDEKGNERTILSVAEVQDRRFLELLARDIT